MTGAVTRRGLLATTAAALVLTSATAAALAVEAIDSEFVQPMLAQARQVIAACAMLGEPFDATCVGKIDRLAASGDLAAAVAAAAGMFAHRTLLSMVISPEARVSVAQGPAAPQLVQSGWRVFLVQISNGAIVPGKLDVASPQAKPANNRYPAGHQHGEARWAFNV